MSVAISWAKKVQLAKCDISVGFPKSSHILAINSGISCMGACVYMHYYILSDPIGQLASVTTLSLRGFLTTSSDWVASDLKCCKENSLIIMIHYIYILIIYRYKVTNLVDQLYY